MSDAEKLKIAIEFIKDLSERGGHWRADDDYESGAFSVENAVADEASEILGRIR